MRIVSFPVSFSFASLPGGCGDEAMIFETLRRKLAENHVYLYRMGAGRPCVNEFGRSHDRRREGIRDLAGPCGLYARCDALARDAAVSDHRLYFRQCGARSRPVRPARVGQYLYPFAESDDRYAREARGRARGRTGRIGRFVGAFGSARRADEHIEPGRQFRQLALSVRGHAQPVQDRAAQFRARVPLRAGQRSAAYGVADRPAHAGDLCRDDRQSELRRARFRRACRACTALRPSADRRQYVRSRRLPVPSDRVRRCRRRRVGDQVARRTRHVDGRRDRRGRNLRLEQR